MKDPYLILGLPKDASPDELTARYEELKHRFSEDRFLPGNMGMEAAEKLSELETAWVMIQSDLDRMRNESHYGGDFGYIDRLIRDGRYIDAQNELDMMSTRNAEWHYFQSIVFYKREWIADAKTQLEMAVNMDPYNQKYITALDRMKLIDGNPNIPPNNLGGQPNPNPQSAAPQRSCGNDCSTCCMAYICTDCLCSMSRCC